MLVSPDREIPVEWAQRGIPLLLISLLPSEVAALIERKQQHPAEHPKLLALLARGLSAHDIARELAITDRSVYRRLAILRDEFGVTTNAELAADLARRGF